MTEASSTKRNARRKPSRAAPSPMLAALESLAGGALVVLDDELRIMEATHAADELFGPLPRGERAPKVFCGSRQQRPVAEALAAGKSVDAVIPSPRDGAEIRIRAEPLGAVGARSGYMLLLEPHEQDTEVERVAGMWTRDPEMKRMLQLLRKVAESDATVLVRGETGSGKELVARAIHEFSARSQGPFHALNCAAMPAALLESELFGHVRGSFTGAVRDNPGHFRLAHKGTLFLDEVAELPLDMQAKLLRVLETHSVLPVGGRESVRVDVRIVAATHRALRKEVEAGRFRADLMYRLRVIPVFLPPLRARKADIELLAHKVLEELSARSKRKIMRLSESALDALERYDWPGNVRELRNALEYGLVVGSGPVLEVSDLPPEIATPERVSEDERYEPALVEGAAPVDPAAAKILSALQRAGGSKSRAARALGMSRVTLWRRLKELGIAELRP